MVVHFLREKLKTLRANDKVTLAEWTGKGKVIEIVYVATKPSKIYLVLQVDDKEKVYLPDVEFLYNYVKLAAREKFYSHVYDTTNNKYGAVLRVELEFEKKVTIELYNENDENVTVSFLVILQEED